MADWMVNFLEATGLSPAQASVWLGLLIGLSFGVLAQVTRFCLRRAVVGTDRRQAAGVWAMALATAMLGTQAAVAAGLISFADHRFMASEMPVVAILAGGLMFGLGMVLTRGCISRLTVLSASGNLRAAMVLVLFAITAYATMKGLLSPLRTALATVKLPLSDAALPGPALVWTALIGATALIIALRSGNRWQLLALAALLGVLVPLGWVGTGYVLYDEFDPIELTSLSFTSSASDTLFYAIASTALTPNFGIGLLLGTLTGAGASALIRREASWQSFESPRQTGRYMLGAVLMGTGGVLAGGCTVGAGLAGVPTLSLAAILALASMIAGAALANRFIDTPAGADLALARAN